MQIGIYIDFDKDGDNRMRCNVGNMNNQSLVLVSYLVSTWKPWLTFKLLSLSLIIRPSLIFLLVQCCSLATILASFHMMLWCDLESWTAKSLGSLFPTACLCSVIL